MKKAVTIKTIAQLAGVSVGAVSTVFSKKNTNVHLTQETREKILRIARENHYVPSVTARAMQSQKSFLLGFFYRIRNSYLQNGILQGIREVCLKHDYDIIVYPAENIEEEFHNLQSVHASRLDGIITMPVYDQEEEQRGHFRQFLDRGIPVVQLFADIYPGCPKISRDYLKIGYESIRTLFENGHRDIAVLIFENYTDLKTGPNSALLMEGMKKAQAEMNVKLTILPQPVSAERKEVIRDAETLADRMLSMKKRPTALITTSGNLACGVLMHVTKAGLSIPEDLSLLVCGDDTEISWSMEPEWALFPVPLREMGRRCAEYCLGLNPLKKPEDRLLYLPMIPGKSICNLNHINIKERKNR